jgi:hypothetical protein
MPSYKRLIFLGLVSGTLALGCAQETQPRRPLPTFEPSTEGGATPGTAPTGGGRKPRLDGMPSPPPLPSK